MAMGAGAAHNPILADELIQVKARPILQIHLRSRNYKA